MTLTLTDLSIHLPQGSRLLGPLSLDVAPGEVASVTGPSGSGKSTLLDAIGGFLPRGFVLEGRVCLNGRDVTTLPPEARRIGVLFQDAILFGHLTVAENLAFGLSAKIRGRAARQAAVEAALEQAGLGGLGPRDPATLSGGQRARAALMRALLAEPLALLLDEPFSKLDTVLRAEIRSFTFRQIRQRAIPALIVTHDPDDALAAGEKTLRLSQQDDRA